MNNRILFVFLESFIIAFVLNTVGLTDGYSIDRVEKRSAAPDRNSDDYPDYQLGVKYDEYPMIVPKKRTAMLVDRLMVALQQAIDEEEAEHGAKNLIDSSRNVASRSKSYASMTPEDVRGMDLQRRGHGSLDQQKGRVYWRCYFNAVTCF